MARYTGNHCPVCEQAFTDEDDVVVCPDCGTPYHRACWQKIGACMHTSEHAAGYEWQPENAPAPAQEAAEIVCPNCGTHNAPGTRHCTHCGVPLDHAADTAPQGDPRMAPGPHVEGYTAAPDGNIYRREIGPEDPIDGIKAKDWAVYFGRSKMYYLMQFFRMSETKKRGSLSLSAFFFGPAYFFYRKMWKIGIITTLATLLLSVPGFMAIVATFNPGLFGAMPLDWLSPASTVCSVLSWILQIVLGIMAVAWYRDHAKKDIEGIYKQYPEGDARTAEIAQHGGTSILSVVLYYGIIGLVQVGILYLAGPSAVQYMTQYMSSMMGL